MGRPPKPEEKRVSEQIGVRFTKDERKQLDDLSMELRMSTGAVLRRALAELYDRHFGKKR
jgi:hypothetical protein